MGAFACYKLPYATGYVRLEQQGAPDVLTDFTDIRGQGFVLAPFAPSGDCPIVVLRPDVRQSFSLAGLRACGQLGERHDVEGERQTYADDFRSFHAELQAGRMEKLVLSRCSRVDCRDEADAMRLFLKASTLYRRQMVVLFSSEPTGTWLMATPEILLTGGGCQWRTMALAGTQRMGHGAEAWSEKNRREQRLVTAYLADRIAQLTEDFTIDPTRSIQAGHLLHLRTNIRFRLPSPVGVGNLISALHPTPAVCGLPADAARRFILANESHDRRYYSGFCGVLDERETLLAVSLRCMSMAGRRCSLYAGGGLLAESSEQAEWEETEAKLETMLRLFDERPTEAVLRCW